MKVVKGSNRILALCLMGGLALTAKAIAQEQVPDQVETGEAGYKIGCSLSATLGVPSCGDLPSGRQFVEPQPTPSPSLPMATPVPENSSNTTEWRNPQPNTEDNQAEPNDEGDQPDQN